MTKETWMDIFGYNGLYRISNLGRVMRTEREVMQYNPQLDKMIPIKYPKKYLKFDNDDGYNRVTLSYGNQQTRFMVHRLVAGHFIPNPESKPHVHHKNHIRNDNRAENLEWVTQQENEDYKREVLQEKFKAISPDGIETIWYNRRECARQLGLQRSGIERCLKGEQSHHRGYRFSYIAQ